MRSCAAVVCVLSMASSVGTLAAPGKKNDPVAAELAKLEGTWVVVSYESGGLKLNDVIGKRIEFKDGKFSWQGDDAQGKILRIDPIAKPKEIDYENAAGKLLAIYELDGDNFRDCISGGKERPKKFESTEENGYMLVTYKRVKADK